MMQAAMDTACTPDRVGLAWRDELALGIHQHLDEIDHLEILADREWHAPRARTRALQELARQVPTSLHGVGMGLGSSLPVCAERLGRMARLVEAIEPSHWSEHLAFVRAGGIEIGHLAVAPRRPETLWGTLENLHAARRVVGSLPHLENVATLIDPPASIWSEEEFAQRLDGAMPVPLLLDLHNLYANAWNFGRNPEDVLSGMPLNRVLSVHLSGGRIVEAAKGRRWLVDDHLHAPAPEIYVLLETLAAKAPQSLTVIIERDGRYPEFAELLEQMRAARAALARGRASQARRMATVEKTHAA